MKTIGRIASLVILVAAIAAVFIYKGGKPKADDTPPPVRPVKSIVVGAATAAPPLRFPGVVDANAGVDLSFEVAGRIVEFPVARGQKVKAGDLLARLDDHNYSNQVANAEAQLAYAESSFKRMEAALAKNAVSQEEYSRARASADTARASLEIAAKALADTRLVAPFSGVVSDTFANNFDTVAPVRPVLKLQNIDSLDIVVSVPESYVLSAPADVRARFSFEAAFDSLPGRTFPVRVKDAARVADPVTQTYRATLTLDAPGDVDILPGMTCTVTAVPAAGDEANVIRAVAGGEIPLAVPSDAIGAAADGKPFVWRLDGNGDGTYTVRRATVALDARSGENVFVRSGIAAGDRIAVAGVAILTEGRIVRLLDESAAAE